MCLTIFKHIYSISADKIGEAIESAIDKCSGPSKVLNLSSIFIFGFFRSFILVFLESKQNYGLQETLIIEFLEFFGSMNFYKRALRAFSL